MGKRERILRGIYEKRRLGATLYVISALISLMIAMVFLSYLGLMILIEGNFKEVLRLTVTTGFPFFVVGLLRQIIAAPRPYELYSFYEECPKRRFFRKSTPEKGGASFPSRHAYSAFAIGTVLSFVDPWCILIFGIPAVVMCVCRVLLGIHFIRDVVAGAAIGVVAGVLGKFLLVF